MKHLAAVDAVQTKRLATRLLLFRIFSEHAVQKVCVVVLASSRSRDGARMVLYDLLIVVLEEGSATLKDHASSSTRILLPSGGPVQRAIGNPSTFKDWRAHWLFTGHRRRVHELARVIRLPGGQPLV